jgi:hypothetical protein
LQKEGRGAIADADIFNNSTPTKSINHATTNGKALALGILKKAAASKQNDLRRSKGFGIVLTKQKNVLPLPPPVGSAMSAATATGSEGSSVSSPTSSTKSSLDSDCNGGDKATNSSLSLLGGYGVDSSDSD